MRDTFVYINHQKMKFDGKEHRAFLNCDNLRDYTWSYDTINSKISRLYKKITSRNIPLVICGESKEKTIESLNLLTQIVESDIDSGVPGKVYLGDYYTNGYITKSTKRRYLIDDRFIQLTLTITSDDPGWYRDTTHIFRSGNDASDNAGVDYPYDYAYDYSLSVGHRSIYCNGIGENAFRIIIYGPVSNPSISIGDFVYRVNCDVASGELLEIDSTNRTIYKIGKDGKKTSQFDKRMRESYIFTPIPSGYNTVSWNESFAFDLIIREKRSEPLWI